MAGNEGTVYILTSHRNLLIRIFFLNVLYLSQFNNFTYQQKQIKMINNMIDVIPTVIKIHFKVSETKKINQRKIKLV